MQPQTRHPNADQGTRLLDLLPELGAEGFGSALLSLAHAAAAQHRAELATQGVEPWEGMTRFEIDSDSTKDKAGHGSPTDSRSVRLGGPVTTEGDR